MQSGGAETLAGMASLGGDPASVRKRVEAMEFLLERSIRIPGIKRAVGLDVVLDLLPFGGTTIAALMGSYMIWEARNLGMSKMQMARMSGNVAVDWLFGMIPWVGAIPDFFFRSNSRNLRIIRKHLDKHHPADVTIENTPHGGANDSP
ncbi:DUF4112 domain-containing protein [Stakelama marina]|uniref:DUF4112 domain-containing protein n=1 Tax=Stakelama marina TaxID=2826939 RepID=A0A8T4IDF7_9SPHN|nr:DUF4112 domain-containing protein [Stakelama marina]MBR0552122.1 DUF4112 domain-containing protein [Stakelama marina]